MTHSEKESQRTISTTNSSEGLGDTIAKVAKAIGVDNLVAALNVDCGCNSRREWFNRKFPYKQKP